MAVANDDGGEVAFVRIEQPLFKASEFVRVHAGQTTNFLGLFQLPPTTLGFRRRKIVGRLGRGEPDSRERQSEQHEQKDSAKIEQGAS